MGLTVWLVKKLGLTAMGIAIGRLPTYTRFIPYEIGIGLDRSDFSSAAKFRHATTQSRLETLVMIYTYRAGAKSIRTKRPFGAPLSTRALELKMQCKVSNLRYRKAKPSPCCGYGLANEDGPRKSGTKGLCSWILNNMIEWPEFEWWFCHAYVLSNGR